MQYFINTSIATIVSSLGECGVELLTLSNKESNFKTSCAVPMAVGGRTSKLTYQNKILYVVKQVITCSWLVFEIDVAKLVLYI